MTSISGFRSNLSTFVETILNFLYTLAGWKMQLLNRRKWYMSMAGRGNCQTLLKLGWCLQKCRISWLLSIVCFCFFKFSCFGVILLFQQFCLEKRQNKLVEIVELANYRGKYLVILCKVSANIDPARPRTFHSPKKILSKNKFAKQTHRFHFQFFKTWLKTSV